MTRQLAALTSDSPVRLTVVQTIAVFAAIATAGWTVKSQLNDIENSQKSHTHQLEQVDKRLLAIEVHNEKTDDHLEKSADSLTARMNDWIPWRAQVNWTSADHEKRIGKIERR